MRTSLIIFLFLSISYSASCQPEEPAVQRKTGCSDPRFVEAELKAYQELLNARAQIEQWRTDSITRLEKRKDGKLSLSSKTYNNNLKSCAGDADCNAGAKNTYDTETKEALETRDAGLKDVREKAAIKYREAQDEYDKAVNDAIKLYCKQSYQASGQDGPIVYSGTICSLLKEFTLIGTHPMLVYPFKFIPDSSSGGTSGKFSYSITQGKGTMSGGGNYTVEGLDTANPRIICQEKSQASVANVSSSGSGTAHINLTSLGKACETP